MARNEKNTRLRKEQVLGHLVLPQTVKELADKMDMNYHTVRRDVLTLVEDGLVSENGSLRNGSVLYVTGNIRPMPEFRASRTEAARMDVLALSYLRSPHTSNGSRAVLRLAEIMAELLAMAANASATEQRIDANTLQRLENAAVTAGATIDAVSNIAKSFLANQVIWNPDLLPGTVNDPHFSVREFLTTYEAYLKAVEPPSEAEGAGNA